MKEKIKNEMVQVIIIAANMTESGVLAVAVLVLGRLVVTMVTDDSAVLVSLFGAVVIDMLGAFGLGPVLRMVVQSEPVLGLLLLSLALSGGGGWVV